MTGPHQAGPVLTAGVPLQQARRAMLMVHGRGADAQSILELARELPADGLACLAPQAAGNTWYPNRFLAPLARNEPWLSSALQRLDEVLADVARAGLPPERTFLLGFSQGACLALEYAARHARAYAGVIGLSGGLIGPEDAPRDYPGSLAGTPVFLGCSDVDDHIPAARVRHTAEVLGRLGARVTLRLYPGMGHTVNRDELKFIQDMLEGIATKDEGR